jgi:hypothetical protein
MLYIYALKEQYSQFHLCPIMLGLNIHLIDYQRVIYSLSIAHPIFLPTLYINKRKGGALPLLLITNSHPPL